jgi:hypothetical protein
MRIGKLLAAAFIVSAGVKIAALAQETPVADDTSATGRLFAPYGKIPDLSDDQKSQIGAIHKTELAEEKKLKDKEHDDIVALLTDSQKKELDDITSKDSIDKRAAEAEHRAAEEEQRAKDLRDKAAGMGATTQP